MVVLWWRREGSLSRAASPGSSPFPPPQDVDGEQQGFNARPPSGRGYLQIPFALSGDKFELIDHHQALLCTPGISLYGGPSLGGLGDWTYQFTLLCGPDVYRRC